MNLRQIVISLVLLVSFLSLGTLKADIIVVDAPMTVTTLYIHPDDTLIFRPGAELIFNDVAPTDIAQKEVGLIVEGKWITEDPEREGNMVIRSFNSTGNRGHVMVMEGADVDIVGIEFHDLGRTRKDIPLAKPTNLPGRYALHFHRCGFAIQHKVKNCTVFNSTSWGFVNHSSNVLFEDCEVDGAFGAAFVAEAGNTKGGFLRCLARNIDGKPITGIPKAGGGFQGNKVDEISAMVNTGDVARHGHGFWLDSPSIFVEDCIVDNSRDQPYFDFAKNYKEFDTGIAPIGPVQGIQLGLRKNNKAIGSGGHELWFLNNPANEITDLTCLDVVLPIISGRFTSNQRFRGLYAVGRGGVFGGVTAISIAGPYGANSGLTDSYLENFDIAVTLPNGGSSFIDGATFVNNIIDVAIDRASDDNFPNVLTLRNIGDNPKIALRNYLKYATVPIVYVCTQRIPLELDGGNFYVLWKEQHPDYILWKKTSDPIFLRNKTNKQIFDQFGVAPNGYLVPTDAEDKGTYFKCLADSVIEIPLIHRSKVKLNGYFAGNIPIGQRTLQFEFNGVDKIELVNVVVGWQVFTFTYDGIKTSTFVNGK